MNALLRQRRTSSVVVALLSIVLGIVLILYKSQAARIFVMVCGYGLLALGIYYTILYFARRSRIAMLQMELLLGIILLLLGIWMVTKTDSVILLIQYVMGAVVVVHGAVDLQASINIRRAGFEKWWVSLLLSAVTLLLGVLIILNPFSALDALLVLIGLVFVFDGLSDLYLVILLSKLFKNVEQAVTDAEQEANAIETDGAPADGEAADDAGSGEPKS